MGRVRQSDVIRLGADAAGYMATLSKKQRRRFVKKTHERGFTVAGQLSGNPDPLKERTPSSLRSEAQRTIATAYKPVTAELNRRDDAARILEGVRAQADEAFRTWITGEREKIGAQAAAADSTLATQQSKIATDLNDNQRAAAADSMKRATAAAGTISDPGQSTALDYSAADAHSRQQVADARTHSAALKGIGNDADTVAAAAMNATVAVREAMRRTELMKTQGDIASDRTKSVMDQAKSAADLFGHLRDNQVDIANKNREFELAQGTLGVKQAGIEADLVQNRRDYKLKTKAFNLDKWKAEHADEADRLKRQIDYDKIASAEGIAAADRKLKEQIAANKIKAGRIKARDKKSGINSKERTLYSQTETAKGLIDRWHRQGKPMAGVNQHLRNLGVTEPMINIAYDRWRREAAGQPGLSASGVAQAKRMGVKHPGYFWP